MRHSAFKNSAAKILRDSLTAAIDFVYPRACSVCEQFDQHVADGNPTCLQCEGDLIPPASNQCVLCAAPVGPYVSTEHGCHHCRAVKLKFGPVVRLGIYTDLMQAACLRAKRNSGNALIHGLAKLLVRERRTLLQSIAADIVIPVPQHWTQRFYRSHNPAEAIATVISQELKLPCATNILRKRRSTGTQKSLSVVERQKNVQGAYTVDDANEINGRRVMLIDDVMTTGITANEITKVLRQAGASQVSLAVIARVLQDEVVAVPAPVNTTVVPITDLATDSQEPSLPKNADFQ